jgi:hypothetical protein
MSKIEAGQEVIDSREIVERIDELKDAREDMEPAEWETSEEAKELIALEILAEQGEQESSDWIHGETLIHRRYWVDFTAETIHDCYEMPKEWGSGKWPFRHMTIDYEAAAKELEHDYSSIDFDGHEYLIRSC